MDITDDADDAHAVAELPEVPPSSALPQFLAQCNGPRAHAYFAGHPYARRILGEFLRLNEEFVNQHGVLAPCRCGPGSASPFICTVTLLADRPGRTWRDGLRARLLGPVDSPYHGGRFEFLLTLPEAYPIEPPTIEAVTPILHPNIDSVTGLVKADLLTGADWTPASGLRTILLSVWNLMLEPDANLTCWEGNAPMRAMNTLFEADRRAWNERTRQHAIEHAGVWRWSPATHRRGSATAQHRVHLLLWLCKQLTAVLPMSTAGLEDVWIYHIIPHAMRAFRESCLPELLTAGELQWYQRAPRAPAHTARWLARYPRQGWGA